MYKQQLEKDVAKFDTAAYLAGLKGKAAEPAAVTAAVKEADKEAVNGNGNSRPSSQNGSTSNLAALDDSASESAPASSFVSAASAQGELLTVLSNLIFRIPFHCLQQPEAAIRVKRQYDSPQDYALCWFDSTVMFDLNMYPSHNMPHVCILPLHVFDRQLTIWLSSCACTQSCSPMSPKN